MGRQTIAILLCAFTLSTTQAQMSAKFLLGVAIGSSWYNKKIRVKGNVPHKNGPEINYKKLGHDDTKDLAARYKKYQDAAKIKGEAPQDVLDVLTALEHDPDEMKKIFQTELGEDGARVCIPRFQTQQPKKYLTEEFERLQDSFTINEDDSADTKELTKTGARKLVRYMKESGSQSFTLDDDNKFIWCKEEPTSGDSNLYNRDLIALNMAQTRVSIFDGLLAQLLGKSEDALDNNDFIQADKLRNKSVVDLLSKSLDGDYEVEVADPLKSFDLSAFVIVLYPLNDMFKIGVAANIGYSFRELNIKNTPIKINESLTGSIGLAVGITDYFQVHAGVGITRREIGFKTDSDYNDYSNAVKSKLVHNQLIKDVLELGSDTIPNQDDTSVQLVLWGFIKALAELKLTATLSLLCYIAYQFDFNAFEVADIGKFGSLKMDGMANVNAGVALGWNL